MHRPHGFALALGLLLLSATIQGLSFGNGVATSKQSYFFGAKDSTDRLCFSKTLPKFSTMPQDVSFTNPTAGKIIKFITITADRFSKEGFTADIGAGAIGTISVMLKLNGKPILPYAIEVKFYCVL